MTGETVASCNMKETLPHKDAERGLRAVLAEGPELIGLQEWPRDRAPVLAAVQTSTNFLFARGSVGGGPIGWNHTRYTPTHDVRGKTLDRGGFMGRLPGRKTKLPPSVATIGIFEDQARDPQERRRETVLVNCHLTAEVQDRHGNYHADKAHKRRVARHKREVRALRRLVRRHRRKGRRVFVVGDFNFDGLALPPLVSCWMRRPGGTLGSRSVDIVFGVEAATGLQVVPTPSDHHSIVATYKRENT